MFATGALPAVHIAFLVGIALRLWNASMRNMTVGTIGREPEGRAMVRIRKRAVVLHRLHNVRKRQEAETRSRTGNQARDELEVRPSREPRAWT